MLREVVVQHEKVKRATCGAFQRSVDLKMNQSCLHELLKMGDVQIHDRKGHEHLQSKRSDALFIKLLLRL